MKNRIFAVVICVVLATALLMFCCCEKETTVYDNLNNLVQKRYSSVTISVTTNDGTDELNGTYMLTENNGVVSVAYSYEQLATFEEEDSKLVAPENRVVTKSGTAKLQNGKVIEGNADELNISASSLTISNLKFAEEYFASISQTEGEFSAYVVQPTAFMRANTSCENMAMNVKYTDSALIFVNISYKIGATSVNYLYEFE